MEWVVHIMNTWVPFSQQTTGRSLLLACVFNVVSERRAGSSRYRTKTAVMISIYHTCGSVRGDVLSGSLLNQPPFDL